MLTDEESKEFWKMMKQIGRNIRSIRRERNLTQEKMSEILGITYRNYQKIEHGDQPLSMRSLFRISRRSSIPIQKLVE